MNDDEKKKSYSCGLILRIVNKIKYNSYFNEKLGEICGVRKNGTSITPCRRLTKNYVHGNSTAGTHLIP